jgi:uncharacterized membrane protein (UPF0127 family)
VFDAILAAALSTVVVHAPKADLTLEVARTEAQREYGLMNRTSLAPHTGMIFVFPGDGPIDFWMKDTLIPLDMVFIAADGTVRKIYHRVPVRDRAGRRGLRGRRARRRCETGPQGGPGSTPAVSKRV